MAAGTHSCSGPDTVLLRIAAAQMNAHLFGGRYAVGLAPMSSAVKPGLQSGLEKGLTAMVGLLAGARSYGALSLTGTTDVGSEMQLMIDLEMMDWLERLAAGAQIDEERMGVETIAETAPRGARFLAEEHTARFFREELWMPGLMDRRAPMAWLADPASMA
ncbi:MAG: hypothetical protein GF393_04730, partial [Armatimonadia bacterium]|nr:hypothetical protein [Armatimonadia bacterium]